MGWESIVSARQRIGRYDGDIGYSEKDERKQNEEEWRRDIYFWVDEEVNKKRKVRIENKRRQV